MTQVHLLPIKPPLVFNNDTSFFKKSNIFFIFKEILSIFNLDFTNSFN